VSDDATLPGSLRPKDGPRLGSFVVQGLLGKGGMARVFRARHEMDGTAVAVKVLHAAEGERGERMAAAFRHEIDAVAGLDHPRITAIYDHGVVSPSAAEASGGTIPLGNPYFVMELVRGRSLFGLRARLGWQALRGILLESLDALAHAHARGLVHRDIKPGNILLSDENRGVKLTDFGLAMTASALDAADGEGGFEGTPAYMAPEQIELELRDVGPWTDLYALGCTAWVLATGALPFPGSTEEQVLGHLHDRPSDFEPAAPVSPDFEPWVRRMMAKRPRDRPSSAAEAAWELVQCRDVNAEGGGESRPRSSGPGLRTLLFHKDISSMVRKLARRPAAEPDLIPAVDGPSREPPPLPERWRDDRPIVGSYLHGAGLPLVGKRAVGLVGREAECGDLWDLLHAVRRDRRPRVVLIEGPAGCGKTALADCVAERADELGGAVVIRARHRAHQGAQDGIGQALLRHHRLAGLPRDNMVRRLRKRLGALGETDPAEGMALAEALVRSDPTQPSAVGVKLSGSDERFTILARHLARLAGSRVVILRVDDLPFGLDAAAMLRHLVGPRDFDLPVLVLATLRSESLPESLVAEQIDALRAAPDTRRVSLGNLDRDDTSRLLRDLVGLDPALSEAVARRAAGNPRFAIEVIRDWAERDLLETGPTGFRLRPGLEPGFPEGLLYLWEVRIQRFLEARPEEDARALEVAAALCQDVDRDLWARCCEDAGLTPSVDLLPSLLRLDLVVPREGGAAGFSFAQAMIREALILRAERGGRLAALHGLIADRQATEEVVFTPDLARHLLKAGRPEEALPVLVEAMERYGHEGEIRSGMETLEALQRALDVVQAPSRHPQRVQAAIFETRFHRRLGRLHEAEAAGARAVEQARASGDPVLIVDALGALANTYSARGRFGDAERCVDEAIELARAARITARLPGLLRSRGFMTLRGGDHDAARALLQEALLTAEASGASGAGGSTAQAWLMLGRASLGDGNVERARFELDEAALRFERAGDRWGAAEICNMHGELHRRAGDLAAADRSYRQAADLFDAIGSGDAVYAHVNRGLVLFERGEAAHAIAVLRRCRRVVDARGMDSLGAAVRVILLAARASSGKWEGWDELLAEAEQALARTGFAEEDIARAARRGAAACLEAGFGDRAARLGAIGEAQEAALGI